MVRRAEGVPHEGENAGNIKIEQDRDKRKGEKKIPFKAGQRNRSSKAQKTRHGSFGHFAKTKEGTL